MTQEQSLNLKQMAERYDVKPRTVRQWIYDGKIKAIRINGLRFTESAIREFEESRTVSKSKDVT